MAKPSKDDSAAKTNSGRKSIGERLKTSRPKSKKSDKKPKSSQQKGNPVSRYLRGAVSELRSVTWPTRKESIRLTIGVVIYSLAFALFIALVDYLFDVLFEQFII